MNAMKKKASDHVFFIVLFALMFIFSAIFLSILFWMLTGSFRSLKNFNLHPFNFFEFSSESIASNYKKAFEYEVYGETKMSGLIVNSLILVLGCTILNVTIPSITGYIVAKYNFKIKKSISIFAIITLVIPTVGSITATYKLLFEIHLMDTFTGVFLMAAGGIGFSFLLFKNYYESISWEYAEAGFIDGASNMRVYLSIMLPQARPIIIAVAIVSFIGNWNDYYTPYMFLKNNPTVAIGLNELSGSQYKSNYPVIFAAMTFTTGVVLILYCFFSKTIMESMSAGGLKG